MTTDNGRNPEILHSWKDISNYTGRSVRTVQRWEQMFDFPVHRTSGELKGSVMAFRSEIDAWLRARALRPHHGPDSTREVVADLQRLQLHAKFTTFKMRSETLRSRIFAFRARNAELIQALGKMSQMRTHLVQSRKRTAG